MVAHHAHRPHRQQHRESLRTATDVAIIIYLDVGQVSLPQLFIENGICLADDFNSFRDYFAKHPHCQSRSGEGLAPDEVVGQAKRFANRANFVLKKVAQRLNELKFHVFG